VQAERATATTTAEASDNTTVDDVEDVPLQPEQPRVLTEVDARVLRELMNDPEFMSSVALKKGVKEQLNEMQGGTKAGDSSSASSNSDDFSSRTFQAFQSLSLGWGGFVAQVTAAVESAAIAIQNKVCTCLDLQLMLYRVRCLLCACESDRYSARLQLNCIYGAYYVYACTCAPAPVR
jgi:hypothetical protein